MSNGGLVQVQQRSNEAQMLLNELNAKVDYFPTLLFTPKNMAEARKAYATDPEFQQAWDGYFKRTDGYRIVVEKNRVSAAINNRFGNLQEFGGDIVRSFSTSAGWKALWGGIKDGASGEWQHMKKEKMLYPVVGVPRGIASLWNLLTPFQSSEEFSKADKLAYQNPTPENIEAAARAWQMAWMDWTVSVLALATAGVAKGVGKGSSIAVKLSTDAGKAALVEEFAKKLVAEGIEKGLAEKIATGQIAKMAEKGFMGRLAYGMGREMWITSRIMGPIERKQILAELVARGEKIPTKELEEGVLALRASRVAEREAKFLIYPEKATKAGKKVLTKSEREVEKELVIFQKQERIAKLTQEYQALSNEAMKSKDKEVVRQALDAKKELKKLTKELKTADPTGKLIESAVELAGKGKEKFKRATALWAEAREAEQAAAEASAALVNATTDKQKRKLLFELLAAERKAADARVAAWKALGYKITTPVRIPWNFATKAVPKYFEDAGGFLPGIKEAGTAVADATTAGARKVGEGAVKTVKWAGSRSVVSGYSLDRAIFEAGTSRQKVGYGIGAAEAQKRREAPKPGVAPADVSAVKPDTGIARPVDVTKLTEESEAGKKVLSEAQGTIDTYLKDKKGWDEKNEGSKQTQAEHAREILLNWRNSDGSYAVIGKKTAEIDTFISKNW